MAMFDDPKKELEKLQKQLLEEEEWFARELDSAKVLIGDVPVKKQKKAPVKTQEPAKTPEKTQPAKQTAKAAKPKSNRGLIALLAAETLGIVGIVAYWLLYILN